MVKFPSWLNGTTSGETVYLSKKVKCPSCGNKSNEVTVDKKGNYHCIMCGSVIPK